MKRSLDIEINTGTIHLDLNETPEWPMERLVDFAARANPKRGFLFVSKVLGKHLPVKLDEMLASHRDISKQLLSDLMGPILFISLAETGTGLGHGVFESYGQQTNREDLIFWHSSRYRSEPDELLLFEESHSHAPSQWMCKPTDPTFLATLRECQTLVLVDDEISTGNTFLNLYSSLRSECPKIKEVVLGALTDFSGKSTEAWTEKMGIKTTCVALLKGSFTFESAGLKFPEGDSKAFATGVVDSAKLASNWGRYGITQTPKFSEDFIDEIVTSISDADNILVLGSGEFLYASVQCAIELQNRGKVVSLQSTTRSPIMLGSAIASKTEVPDAYQEGVNHFIYNLDREKYDAVVMIHEPTESKEFLDFFKNCSIFTRGIDRAKYRIY